MSPRTGRPLSDNPKTERLFVRVTPDEKAQIFECCKVYSVSILDLIKVGMIAVEKK